MEWFVIIFIIYGIVSSIIKNKNTNQQTSRTGNNQTPRNYPGSEQQKRSYPSNGWPNEAPKRETKSPLGSLEQTLKDLDKQFTKDKWSDWEEDRNVLVATRTKEEQKVSNQANKYQGYLDEMNHKMKHQELNDITKSEIGVKDDLTSSNTNDEVKSIRANARQGLIWAEIYGPPKSKKPHYSLLGKSFREN